MKSNNIIVINNVYSDDNPIYKLIQNHFNEKLIIDNEFKSIKDELNRTNNDVVRQCKKTAHPQMAHLVFADDKHYCDIANERIRKALAGKEVGE